MVPKVLALRAVPGSVTPVPLPLMAPPRVGVIGVVEAIEALGTGLELQSLMQRDEFAESRVHVGVVRPVELIGPGEAIRSRRVCGKG